MSPETGELLLQEVAPRIRSAVPYCVRTVGCEDHEEIIQDTICMAAKLYDNAEKAGKQVTPGNIAYYAIQHAKSGRRAYGQSKTDPLHPSTQLNGRARLSCFEDAVKTEEGSEEPMLLTEVFSNEQEDPSTKAARNLDWESFTAPLNDRFKAILNVLAEGGQLKEVAKKFKVSTSTINTSKNQLKVKLLEFFGSDILKEIATMPQWRTNLLAHREMLACREERYAS